LATWWLVVGTPENWEIALASKGIWGLRDSPRHKSIWERLQQGDRILFYATNPVGGAIGYATVGTKFKQNKPLWPEEVQKQSVIWPYRFEFDTDYVIPRDRWEDSKVSNDKIRLLVRGGFQTLEERVAEDIVSQLKPEAKPPQYVTAPAMMKKEASVHETVKRKLLEIGRIQKFVVDDEYVVDGKRLDVVWRRIDKGVPTYVFEVQVGGDIYHALGKLKHAFDLWNSNIFLISSDKDLPEARSLLSGTYHEIRDKVKLIQLQDVDKLLQLKKQYRDFESQLGILG
jgi:predicted RNA-binding protein